MQHETKSHVEVFDYQDALDLARKHKRKAKYEPQQDKLRALHAAEKRKRKA